MSKTFKDEPYWIRVKKAKPTQVTHVHDHHNTHRYYIGKKRDSNGKPITVMRYGYLFNELDSVYDATSYSYGYGYPSVEGDVYKTLTTDNEKFIYAMNGENILVRRYSSDDEKSEPSVVFLKKREVYIYKYMPMNLYDTEGECTIDVDASDDSNIPCYKVFRRHMNSNTFSNTKVAKNIKSSDNGSRRGKERNALRDYTKIANSNILDELDYDFDDDFDNNVDHWYYD